MKMLHVSIIFVPHENYQSNRFPKITSFKASIGFHPKLLFPLSVSVFLVYSLCASAESSWARILSSPPRMSRPQNREAGVGAEAIKKIKKDLHGFVQIQVQAPGTVSLRLRTYIWSLMEAIDSFWFNAYL
jgi:hypothetical protein